MVEMYIRGGHLHRAIDLKDVSTPKLGNFVAIIPTGIYF